MVTHALRVTVRKTRRACVYPARHHASRHKDPNYPLMGERIRLRTNQPHGLVLDHALLPQCIT